MPLPGGATDKFGNRYEGRWTVFCMIEVIDESADSICLEPPGEEGEGVEFWLEKGDSREYHQVKRQQSTGSWTLVNLRNNKILSNFWKKLKTPTANCTFISTDRAFQLDELADNSMRANSWEVFKQGFLNVDKSQTSERLRNFQELCRCWNNCPEIDAYNALKRIKVKTVDENTLRTIVESRLAALVEGESATVIDVLAQYALDKVHHELTAHDIWHHLENRKEPFRRREWGKSPHVLAAVDKVNDRYLDRLHKEAIAGKVIPRDEVDIILEKLTSPDGKHGVLVAGEAGVGKSGVILQSVEALRKKGVPIIAFRVDRLDPTDSPAQVGEQLEKLPGSPAHVLANIAQGRDCVLIIDQLDAVSTASGRNTDFLDCVEQIIDQVKAYPQMRLLLACRKFDLDYDGRLKRLTGENGIAETVTVNRLSHEKVREMVVELGLDGTLLNNKQLELLSIPLHLKLLAEVADVSKAHALNFRTAKDLYDKFWDYKKDIIHARLGDSEHWTDVIYTLCDYMSKHQRLAAPKARVDRYGKTAEWMASEHVLILDGQQYSFFHESFFDYAFARRFVGEDEELLNFLGSRERQHLFRRAQVRQILFYERDAERDRYLNDLQALLTSPNIRFHIKQVVFALLATLDDPTQEEWEIIASLMGEQADPITQQVWRTMRSSVRWFQRLDSLGIIEQWLRDESEERIGQTVTLLSIMQRQIPDRVAELAEPFIGVSKAWRDRLNSIIQGAELSTERRFFNFFLRLIQEGILDQPRGIINYSRDFWMQIYSLPKERPEWACEAISCYLNRYLDLSLSAGQPNLFDRNSGALPQSQSDERVLIESARNAPRAFIEYLFPFMLRVIELTATQGNDLPWFDSVWDYRPYGRGYDLHHALLSEMEVALSHLAANHPEDFSLLAEQQFRSSNFETIQFLLIRAYTANGKRFADEAIDYLCEQPARLETGYSAGNGNIHAAPYWATRQLIEATTPHCSEESLVKLEAVILDYYSRYEKTARGLKFRGYPQLVLLDAIVSSQRTKAASSRLQEWKRKFTDLQLLEPLGKINPPESIEASFVGSPVPKKAADKMNDEQWLKAIERYDYNDLGSRFQSTGKLIGGAHQLSSLLQSQVKDEPLRFAELIHRFPDSANSSYFDAVLRGIAEVGLGVETAFRVCQRCHQLPNRPCGRSISWLIEKLAELPWSQQALDIVIWYALEDPDPEQELWRTETPNEQVYKGGNISDAGIDSTRSSAVEAIAALIFADKNRASYFRQPLQQIVQGPSIAVRACAAEALTAVLNYDRDLAVNLFQQLCETEDTLLGTQTVEQFLYYALPTHFEALSSIVERMIVSELSEVVKVGARQACLISLDREEAGWLAELCLSGTEAHRIAAAEIFVANLRNAHLREFCENILIQLFNDLSEEVRSQAARCFLHFEGEELTNYISLVEAFVDSPAFTANHYNLIRALEETTAKLPDEATYRVCDRFLDGIESDAPNTRNRSFIDANQISQLLLRLYTQTKNQALQSSCLDLVDRMAQMEVYGLDQALTQYER
ncbi:ATP-binding protein [Microcoleus sp. FACHB-53]|nr:ATP-binding protein [Microcoleus sp. FACHB-53]